VFEALQAAEEARPKNMGALRDPTHYARFKGPCGDTAEIWMRIDGGRIRKVTFMTDGCEPSIACCAAAARLAEGLKPEKADQLTPEAVLEKAGDIPVDHHHCAQLAVVTLQSALLSECPASRKEFFLTKLKSILTPQKEKKK